MQRFQPGQPLTLEGHKRTEVGIVPEATRVTFKWYAPPLHCPVVQLPNGTLYMPSNGDVLRERLPTDSAITHLDEYQAFARQSTIPWPKDKLQFLALKLGGEAGEVLEKIGKQMRGDFEWTDERIDDLMRELGDNLWYISNIADYFGRKLSTVATMNRTKLLDRRARGVSRGEGDNR